MLKFHVVENITSSLAIVSRYHNHAISSVNPYSRQETLHKDRKEISKI